MKLHQLEIEHKYKNRFMGKHLLTESNVITVIGSIQEAHINLVGEDISAVHALIEYSDGKWILIDAGSEKGTWISKKPIVHHLVDETVNVQIGGHQLTLKPIRYEKTLFNEKSINSLESVSSHAMSFHQVAVTKNGNLIYTKLLGKNEKYEFHFLDNAISIGPPSGSQAEFHECGPFVIRSQIVKSDIVHISHEERFSGLKNIDYKAPSTILMILAVLIVSFLLFPKGPRNDLNIPAPDQNQFTKMIFDAEAMQKRREAAQVRQQAIAQQVQAPPEQEVSAPQRQAASTETGRESKVVNNLKMEGLTQLLGKISERAAANVPQMQAQGRAPSSTTQSATLAAVGGIADSKNNSAQESSTYRVQGVGTASRTGAAEAMAGVAGLSAAGVGSASVGILEEETEIEGGLDRDVIARIIRNQLGEIRYCYERQLSASPDLYGKVVVRFSIDAKGLVNTQRIGLTTLRNATVEGCILRRVSGWRFPEPRGGTTVLVTYPFLFRSTN